MKLNTVFVLDKIIAKPELDDSKQDTDLKERKMSTAYQQLILDLDLFSKNKFQILLGDSAQILKSLPNDHVDLIVTSPPYSDQRKNTYGGIRAEDYVKWFLPIAIELKRVLKPRGTFILNIKEKLINGERSTYVLELIMALRAQGWIWTEEFIWNKKNSFPGKWPNRFRDSWERLLQFNKNRDFAMYQEAVMVPIGDWARNRLKNLSETDLRRDNAKNNSAFGKNVSNWLNKEYVYPTNSAYLGYRELQ